jgi:hypothetical protein
VDDGAPTPEPAVPLVTGTMIHADQPISPVVALRAPTRYSCVPLPAFPSRYVFVPAVTLTVVPNAGMRSTTCATLPLLLSVQVRRARPCPASTPVTFVGARGACACALVAMTAVASNVATTALCAENATHIAAKTPRPMRAT